MIERFQVSRAVYKRFHNLNFSFPQRKTKPTIPEKHYWRSFLKYDNQAIHQRRFLHPLPQTPQALEHIQILSQVYVLSTFLN